jgi:hypothetical protein
MSPPVAGMIVRTCLLALCGLLRLSPAFTPLPSFKLPLPADGGTYYQGSPYLGSPDFNPTLLREPRW